MRTAVASCLALALAAFPALAAWPNQPALNLPICRATGAQSSLKVLSDVTGGVLLTWTDDRNGSTNKDIFAHHVLASGALDPAWPVDGLAVCTQPGNQMTSTMASDGAGGAFLVWRDLRNGVDLNLYVQHLLSTGSAAPGWPADGLALCTATGDQYYAFMAADGGGGVVVSWMDNRSGNYDIYAQHVLATGIDPAWPVDGRVVCAAATDQQNPAIVSDNAGGAVVAWSDYRGGATQDIYAQRILATGVVDPAWPVDGRALCTASYDQGYQQCVSDGAGGAIVTWQDTRTGLSADIYAQHVLSSGAVDAAWPADGRGLCTQAASQLSPMIVADAAGGAYVTWQDARSGTTTPTSYVQHVSATGIVDPAWPVDGRAVSAVASTQNSPRLAADGAGGVLVSWSDNRSGAGYDIYAQHLLTSGASDPSWPVDGRAVCNAGADQTSVAILGDDAGGMVVAWLDSRNGAGTSDVYAGRVARWGYVGTPEAEVTGVQDVPNDNGGKVRLSWNASYLDASMDANLAAYDVYRSVPPNSAAQTRANGTLRTLRAGDLLPLDRSAPIEFANTAGGYAWEYVSTVAPNHFASQYGTLAPTAFDSVAGSNPKTAFLVLARNAAGTMFWPSLPALGYSVDNLPPFTPAALTGQYASGIVALHWAPNTDADLGGYRVYRGPSAVFVPGPGNLVATPSDTGCAVAGDAAWFYKLSAVDTHGNESGFAALTPGMTTEAGGAAPAFALGRMQNPSPGGRLTVTFSLPGAGPARLELVDVSGRRVEVRDLTAATAGHEALSLGDGRRLPAGIYFVRLSQGANVASARVTVLD